MPVSKYKQAQIDKLRKQAIAMYKQGLSVRQISKVFDVSHTYIWKLIKRGDDLSTG